MGRKHSEEAVLDDLMRKRVYFTRHGGNTHEHGILREKTIVLTSSSTQVGIRTLGKLDFMKKMGWVVLDHRNSSSKEESNDDKAIKDKAQKEVKRMKLNN